MNFKRLKQHNPEPFDVNALEDEIGQLVQQRPRSVVEYAPPATETFEDMQPTPPATDEELGMVTADTVMAQHERTAKTFEDMREPLKELAAEHQKALSDLAASMASLDDMAKRYRTLGESKRDIIQKTAGTITKVRELCATVMAEIDTP